MRIALALLLAAPLPAGAPAREGTALFQRHCARCHGADGLGRSIRGERLPGGRLPEPARLAQQGEEALAQLILEGRSGMPGFRVKLSREQARGLARQLIAGARPGR